MTAPVKSKRLYSTASDTSAKYRDPDQRQRAGRTMRQRLSDQLVALGLQHFFCLSLTELPGGYWTLDMERWDGGPMDTVSLARLLTPETLVRIRHMLTAD